MTNMNIIRNWALFFFAGIIMAGCNKVTYRKTAGGMPYQLYKGKDTLKIFPGNIIKMNITQKINDSVYFSTAGKIPYYQPVNENGEPYDLSELWTKLKKGDSVVATQMMDTFIKRNPQNIRPQFKKGDRIITYIKILNVFTSDSLYQVDNNAEMLKYAPQMKKEQEEQNAKAEKEMMEIKQKEEREMEASGEAAKERSEMEAYLKSKKINAQKMGRGTYVWVKQQGSGPLADSGKFLTVKYTGKFLKTDSVFQSNFFTFQMGKGKVISGLDEGLKAFKQGGKGTLYIPAFRAYGKNPPPNSPFKPNDALIFDIELQAVSDTMPAETPRVREPKKN